MKNQKTDRPLSASGLMRLVPQPEVGVGDVGDEEFEGDDGQHSTTPDRFEVPGIAREPKSSDVKSVLKSHDQPGHVPYYSRGMSKRLKQGNATHASPHQLRQYEHLNVNKTSNTG